MSDPLPRVLYIAHRVPWPPDKGDRIRNWNVLKQLTSVARVSLAALDESGLPSPTPFQVCEAVAIEPQPRWRQRLGAICYGLASRSLSEGVFYNTKLKDTIVAWHKSKPFDAVVVSASSLVSYLRFTNLKSVPAFIDVVDVDSQKWFDFAAASRGLKRWLYRYEGNRIRGVERDLPNWANTITLVSDAETESFNSIAGRDCAITATNGVDLEYFRLAGRASDGNNHHIAFVGAMDYLPNIDAVEWFAREVWPQVKSKYSDAEFQIIGRDPAAAVTKLAQTPGVTVTGTVPDIRPLLADAAVVVVPMRLGRGLQNKVLEALAMEKAVIASPVALAALKAEPDRDLLQADSPREWIEAITALLDDPARRREFGANGRRYVEEHHDWETCLRPLTDRIRAVCRQECAV